MTKALNGKFNQNRKIFYSLAETDDNIYQVLSITKELHKINGYQGYQHFYLYTHTDRIHEQYTTDKGGSVILYDVDTTAGQPGAPILATTP